MAQTCEHLRALEKELRGSGADIDWDGKSWWRKARDTSPGGVWIYFQCFLNRAALEARFELGLPVAYDEYDGRVAGHEAGFYCKEHDSAIVGVHRNYAGKVPEFR